MLLVGRGNPGMAGRDGKPGIGKLGFDGDVLRGAEVNGGPGWVVMATVPGVVRSQPVVNPKTTNAIAATHTCVLISATIGATES